MIQQVWLLVFASHAALAAIWWWLMPGGFPSWAPQYWFNQVLPLVVLAVIVAALFAPKALRTALAPAIQLAFPVFWMVFAVSLRLTFPDSIGFLWNLLFAGGFVLAVLWVRQYRFTVPHAWLLPCFALPALWMGWVLPGSQRAEDPATHPAEQALPELPSNTSAPAFIKLSKDAQVHPSDGRTVIRRDQLVLTVQPLLSIANRSPDRCWTELALPEDSRATSRKLAATMRDGQRWKLLFRDEDQSLLEIVAAREGAIEIDARSRLAQPVFSHVSQSTSVTIRGHKKLSVSFSPIPGKRIEVPGPMEAARFAYVDATGTFHVAQASSQDHGPYTELGVGPLKSGEPLVLTLHDGETAAFRISLADWAAQASTQLSPAAGWGVPANAIELVRAGDPEEAPAEILFSLASSHIGRGSPSVGMAAGVYRNRITVQPVAR